ncbi:MAG TPA: DUF2231 domain-containing protein [Flavitalea sp.]|nr:DUF2231 domain-containing protein [Flavitalea sp.]
MINLALNTFIGRFHPMIVHLPIGFLLLAIVFLLMSRRPGFASLQPAVSFSFGAGAVASVVAIITGYFLSTSGDYDEELLLRHQVMGYITSTLAIGAWLLSRQTYFAFQSGARFVWLKAILLLAIVSYTGHLGGSLTHGEDYLSFNPSSNSHLQRTRDFNQALVFRDLIQPILEDKCGSCHNNSKKKGRLSFASIQSLLKGGKHGAVIKSGDPTASEIIKRIQLPPSDKKFMPADDKPPLSSSESRILGWWIAAGVSEEDKKLSALKIPGNISEDIAQFLKPTDTMNVIALAEVAVNKQFQLQKLPAIPQSAIQGLSKKGFQVHVIHYNPDLLDIRMDASPDSTQNSFSTRLRYLHGLKDHIIWLDIKNAGLKDADMVMLNEFKNLQKLNLSYNPVTDAGLRSLTAMDYLQSINLTGTMITEKSLASLNFKDLKSVYGWRSGLTKLDSAAISAYPFRVITGAQ